MYFNTYNIMQQKNYVIYRRVSTKRQGKSGLGLEAQQALVESYLQGKDHNIIATFSEVESGKKNNRIELNKALILCRQHNATLLVAKLGRLSRNAAFTMKLKDSSIDIVCADMPEADKLTIGVLALINQTERERISANVKAALAIKKKQLALEGKKLGNPNPPSESQKAKAKESMERITTTNPNTIAAKKLLKDKIELATLKNQKLTYKQLANDLNIYGIKRIRGKSEWTEHNVKYPVKMILPELGLNALPKFTA